MILTRYLTSIGLVLLVASLFFTPYPTSTETRVERGSGSGFMISTSNNIHVTVTPETGGLEFSLYFLHASDANNTIVQNRSIDLIPQLVTFENITSFDDIILIPHPGIYTLFFTSSTNETRYLLIDIRYVAPNHNALLFGGLSAMIGGLLEFASLVCTRRQEAGKDA